MKLTELTNFKVKSLLGIDLTPNENYIFLIVASAKKPLHIVKVASRMGLHKTTVNTYCRILNRAGLIRKVNGYIYLEKVGEQIADELAKELTKDTKGGLRGNI